MTAFVAGMRERPGAGAGGRLHALVAGLGAPYGLERSVKLVAGAVLADRFLLTLHKSALGAEPAATLLALGAAFGLPAAFRAEIAARLGAADIVHLGFEGGADDKDALYKIYLENAGDFAARRAAARAAGESLPVHTAFKWRPGRDGGGTVARYLCPPCRTPAEIEARMEAMFGAGEAPLARTAAAALLAQAARRAPGEEFLFMEVEEAGNPRRSFDINLYDAELRGAEVLASLAPAWAHFRIPSPAAARTEAALAGETLGHVAGGIGRDGAEFLTLYFGIEAR